MNENVTNEIIQPTVETQSKKTSEKVMTGMQFTNLGLGIATGYLGAATGVIGLIMSIKQLKALKRAEKEAKELPDSDKEDYED